MAIALHHYMIDDLCQTVLAYVGHSEESILYRRGKYEIHVRARKVWKNRSNLVHIVICRRD